MLIWVYSYEFKWVEIPAKRLVGITHETMFKVFPIHTQIGMLGYFWCPFKYQPRAWLVSSGWLLIRDMCRLKSVRFVCIGTSTIFGSVFFQVKPKDNSIAGR